MDEVKTIEKEDTNDDITFTDIIDGVGHIAKAIGNFTDEILAVFK